MIEASYVLPLLSTTDPPDEFVDYINQLTTVVEVLLIDASPEPVFLALEARCSPGLRHLRPDSDFSLLKNGKVRGVLTGLRWASHDRVIIADDDVRYTAVTLSACVAALGKADVVRPQNYFQPLPWHACIDSARILINRVTGGDWPGTLAVDRRILARAGGYDGDVLFENLELVRTVEAVGGRALCLRALLVRRLPPRTQHFWTQRVRQAYDEFARPGRLVAFLSLVPVATILVLTGQWSWLLAIYGLAPMVIAEYGRQIGNGTLVFPRAASLCAPLWIAERACCAWAAVAVRVVLGGVRYHGRLVSNAANSSRLLAARACARQAVDASSQITRR